MNRHRSAVVRMDECDQKRQSTTLCLKRWNSSAGFWQPNKQPTIRVRFSPISAVVVVVVVAVVDEQPADD